MGSSILQRWKQVDVPTAWKCARKTYGEFCLIEEVGSSPLALAIGGRGVYGHARRFLNEYGYIRTVAVKHGVQRFTERFRIIVQGNDDSGKRVWEWGYDRYVNSQSVPLNKGWVRGIAPTGAKAKELAEASLSEWASTIALTRGPVYPAGQDLAEWVSLFDNCEDLDENGHPSLVPAEHDHYRALVQHKLGGAERALEVAQGFCDIGKDQESAADYPSYLQYKQGTWENVAAHYTKEIATINGGLQIIAKIISKITDILSIRRDEELKEKGIKTGDWPDLNVIEGFSYRQARIQSERDLYARIVARDSKREGVGSDAHLRAVRFLESKQEELGRASAVYQRSRGLGVVQLAEN
jgi:hypothetical protein